MLSEYISVLEDGGSIELFDLCVCPILSNGTNWHGWNKHGKTYYQVSFYDKYKDFEISRIFKNVIDAAYFFLELRDVITDLVSEGRRVKSKRPKYEKIYSYDGGYGPKGRYFRQKRSR